MTSKVRQLRFMRAIVSGGEATLQDGKFVPERSGSRASLPQHTVRELAAQGLLELGPRSCKATREARSWIKRQMADQDQLAAQHRILRERSDGAMMDLSESPLARLAHAAAGKPAFLEPHQVEAGERIRHLVERAHLNQRTTMSYDPSRLPAKSGNGAHGNVTDMALDARQALHKLMGALPSDCAGVVLDVCGYLKGLQQVELEREWPRRSAKLVLRIGLDQAASHFGLSPVAEGTVSQRAHKWLSEGARPMEIG